MRAEGRKKWAAIALAVVLVVSGIGYVPKAEAEAVAQETGDYSQEVNEVCNGIISRVTEPAFGSSGGEWAALILGRSGRMTEEWKTKYLAAVKSSFDKKEEKTPELKEANKLDEKKLTENSRAIIGLYSAGADVTDFNGWNLCAPISGDNTGGDKTEESQDYKDTIRQGINGAIYALIALDYAGYQSAGENKVTDLSEENATTLRDDYVLYILSAECEEGGWALGSTTADPDITMMAVQALSNYMDLSEVKDAVERALTVMSKQQNAEGGYESWGSVNSESVSQVICGLTMLGIDPTTDERFIKNGKTVVDALQKFSIVENGTRVYAHTANSDGSLSYNGMATEQAGYTMVALWCQKKGKKLYQNGFQETLDPLPTTSPKVTDAPTPTPVASAAPTPAATIKPVNPDIVPTPTPKAPETTQTPEAANAPETTQTPETTKTPAATEAPQTTKALETTVISKIVKKAAVEKGKKITIKTVVNGKKVKCKVVSYNKKALQVTVKNGKLVIKAGKKAKTGKTYKIVIKYKKGKKTVRKTVKITVK